MPPSYSPLPASTDPQSTSDSDPLPPAKERPLRPPPFEIPDPFAPFTRSRPSIDSTHSSLDSDIAFEDEDDRGDRGLSEKIGSTLDGDDPEDASSWRERKHAQSKRRRFILGAIVTIPLCLLFSGFLVSNVVSPSTGLHTFKGQGLQKLTREHLENGTFYPESVELNWLAEAGDGVYSQRTETGSILLVDVNKNETRVLVDGDKVRDHDGTKLEWYRFKVSADLKYILFDTDWLKQWRHSTYANFWIHDIEASTTRRLRSPSYPPRTSFASFSPKNHHVAYVHANDLYVLESPPSPKERNDPIRITRDGSATTFNGVPDWVYEEEVFSSDVTTWWSPTATKLAFLSFDEQDVPEYEFPVYNSDWSFGGADNYPSHTIMRYPKAGYPNPKVRLRVFDLDKYLRSAQGREWTNDAEVERSTKELVLENPFPDDDFVISEVVWVGENELMVKATNRIATIERVARFEFTDETVTSDERIVVGKVVREGDFEKLDGGWAEPGSNIVGISSTVLLHSQSTPSNEAPVPSYPPGYLDILPSPSGFNHLAYFSPADSKDPVFLTEGEWEIDGEIQMVDVQRGLVYFIAANPSIERHLYSVPLPTSVSHLAEIRAGKAQPVAPTKYTETRERGHYTVSFSPFGGVYQLNYEGPGVPWQKLVKVDDADYDHVLTNNSDLRTIDSRFQHAEISYPTITIDSKVRGEENAAQGKKVELNAMELRPPLMDVSGKTKYPVLFQVYGGPNSQMVTTKFQRDWQHYICTALGYVIVRVDPRGTGFRGRRHRVLVKNRLGEVERSDVIEAARQWSQLPYIDEKRVGIWGWSYGGFLTTKVIEANSSVFNLGMAVAPVTDWRYYDSVYTERYMSTPQLNREGYDNSSVSEMDGFNHAHYALAHGSGDDNVHYQNTAALLDKFTVARVRDFRFRMFTDADHSMGLRGAYWELMAWLESFLLEKFGEGGRTKAKWKITVDRSEHD